MRMPADAGNRPSYGRSKAIFPAPALFYEKFEMRYDLILPDREVGERMDLLEIFREIRDDDHADEFTADTNAQATDKNHRDGNMPYDALEDPQKGNDYVAMDEDQEDMETGQIAA